MFICNRWQFFHYFFVIEYRSRCEILINDLDSLALFVSCNLFLNLALIFLFSSVRFPGFGANLMHGISGSGLSSSSLCVSLDVLQGLQHCQRALGLIAKPLFTAILFP